MEKGKDNMEAAAKKSNVKRTIGRIVLVILTFLIFILLTLFFGLNTIINGPSKAARELFTTTVLESGQLKFLAQLFLSTEEIEEIVSRTSMGTMDTKQNTALIDTAGQSENFDLDAVTIEEINGRTYFAKMMIVNDPSRVRVSTTYPWGEYGKELKELVGEDLGGVNGGLYVSDSNKGGRPLGVVVSNGEILFNQPQGWKGIYLIGFDRDNILQIENIEGMSASAVEKLIREQGIRDAVAFQDEASDANNHFVPLIINGQPRELNGQGSGANPRTVIAQRADGSVLLLVTDGRGSAGHLGATASDLISILLDAGAVNAANLDGGSSSTMVYDGQYEMTSVTLYYANSSWRLPTAFTVTRR